MKDNNTIFNRIPGHRIFNRNEILIDPTCDTLIYQSDSTLVYKRPQSDGRPAMAFKVYTSSPGTSRHRIHNEHLILSGLNLASIPSVMGRGMWRDQPVLALEFIEAMPLTEWCRQRPVEIDVFFSLALKITQITEALHAQKIFHQDLSGENFLIHPEDREIWLIDFDLAHLFHYPGESLPPPSSPQGSLPYLAPEQTGRMNQFRDQRADLYSLGVLFYFALTGHFPFSTSDTLELIHSHLARTAPSVHKLRNGLPPALSQMVDRLLEKRTSYRYQTARGLKSDLEKIYHIHREKKNSPTLSLGRDDFPSHPSFSSHLYGRDKEEETLVEAFSQTQRGKGQTALILGPQGVGKTSLGLRLEERVIRQQGYFLSGNFLPPPHRVPYNPFGQIINQFCHLLAHRDEKENQHWRQTINEKFSPYLGPLLDIAPSLKWFVDAPLTKRDDTLDRSRLQLALEEFIQLIVGNLHPLVLFLDDIHWADTPSLEIFSWMANHLRPMSFLLVTTCTSLDHPKAKYLLESGENQSRVWTKLELKNLPLDQWQKMLEDTLLPPGNYRELAQQTYNKTGGNPHFGRELIKSLHQEGSLYFDTARDCWNWKQKELEALESREDAVQWLSQKLTNLPEKWRQLLKYAALLGGYFHPLLLAKASVISISEVEEILQKVCHIGLIHPLPPGSTTSDGRSTGTIFRFAHRHILERTLDLHSEEEEKEHYEKISRHLDETLTEKEKKQFLFPLVKVKNKWRDQLEMDREKLDLARLNKQAGKRAQQKADYRRALQYFTIGRGLISTLSNGEGLALNRSLTEKAAEMAFLEGQLDQTEEWARELLDTGSTPLERHPGWELLFQVAAGRNDHGKTIEIGEKALAELDITLISSPPLPLEIDEVSQWGDLEDPVIEGGLSTLMKMLTSAYLVRPKLIPSLIYTMIEMTRRGGHSPLGTQALMVYAGLLQNGPHPHPDLAFSLGKKALEIFGRYSTLREKPRLYFDFYCFLAHWHLPWEETVYPLSQIVTWALDGGIPNYAGYAALGHTIHSFHSEHLHLDQLQSQVANYRQLTQKLHLSHQDERLALWESFIEALTDEVPLEKSPWFTASPPSSKSNRNRNREALYLDHHLVKTIALCHLGRWEEARREAEFADRWKHSSGGLINYGIFAFYFSLTHLVSPLPADDQPSLYVSKIAGWTDQSWENFGHIHHLLQGELSRIDGRSTEALNHYHQALELAKQSNRVFDTALIHRRLAEYWEEKQHPQYAQIHRQEIQSAYRLWGAKSLVSSLSSSTETERESSPKEISPLDLQVMARATHVISSEVEIFPLLEKMLELVLTHTGAERAVVLDYRDRDLRVQAWGDHNEIQVGLDTPIEEYPQLCISLVRASWNRRQEIIIDHAATHPTYRQNPYIRDRGIKSILCLPIVHQGRSFGLLYLENNLIEGAFSEGRGELLRLLSTQVAISYQNALLYESMKNSTRELTRTNRKLTREVEERKKVEQTLVQSRKFLRNLHQYYLELSQFPAIREGNLRKSLEKITEVCCQALNCHRTSVWKFDSDFEKAHCLNLYEASLDRHSQGQVLIREEYRDYFDAIHKYRIMAIENVAQDPRTQNFQKSYTLPLNIQSMLDSVILLGGEVVGVLCAEQVGSTRHWTLEEQNFSVSMSDFVAMALSAQERREAEKLRREKEEAEATTRAKSQFLATMSHEIRTPMNGVLGLTRLLLNTSLDKKQREFVEMITQSGEALLAILNDILDFSKIEAGKMTIEEKPFSLDQCLHSIIDLFQSQIAATDLELTISMDGDTPLQVKGDSVRLRQILLNLVSNAIKFTSQGRIEVVVKALKREGEKPTREYEFAVRDTGIGIPPNKLQHIFDSFTQIDTSTTRQYGGTGLGLAISSQLVELMGGRIWVESTLGEGSTFYFTLPLEPTEEREVSPPTPAPPEPSPITSEKKAIKILLVEDNLINQALVKEILRRLGYDLTIANNGAQALEILETTPHDLVFMDVHMPVMDGLEATVRIRSHIPEAQQPKIIAITASALPQDQQTCLEAGMDDFLSKPIDFAKLKQALAEWGEEAPPGPIPPSTTPSQQRELDEALLFDRSKLDELRQFDEESNQDLAQSIAEIFLEDAPSYLKSMKTSLVAKKMEELVRATHTLKGSALNIGAQKLARTCLLLERRFREENLEEGEQWVAAVEKIYLKTEMALKEYLEKMPSDQ